MSEYKIAAIGDRDSVIGFRALGLDVFPAENAAEAKELLHTKAKENYAIIYLTEDFARDMSDEIAKYKDAVVPAVILIPGKDGPLGLGMDAVKTAALRAVGSDIL